MFQQPVLSSNGFFGDGAEVEFVFGRKAGYSSFFLVELPFALLQFPRVAWSLEKPEFGGNFENHSYWN